MSSRKTIISLAVFSLLVMMLPLSGEDGQMLPSPYYLQDDVQYFPAGTEVKLPNEQRASTSIPHTKSSPGELLFSDVVSVRFTGPESSKISSSWETFEANDGSTSISIYERYIALDAVEKDGATYRTFYAYESIAQIKQRVSNH